MPWVLAVIPDPFLSIKVVDSIISSMRWINLLNRLIQKLFQTDVSYYNIEWQNILDIKEIASQDDEIYVFCRSGNRSEKAKKILEEAGYKQVYNIGGIVDASVFIQDIRYNSEN